MRPRINGRQYDIERDSQGYQGTLWPVRGNGRSFVKEVKYRTRAPEDDDILPQDRNVYHITCDVFGEQVQVELRDYAERRCLP